MSIERIFRCDWRARLIELEADRLTREEADAAADFIGEIQTLRVADDPMSHWHEDALRHVDAAQAKLRRLAEGAPSDG